MKLPRIVNADGLTPMLREYRKRVIEDAYELVAAVEIYEALSLATMGRLKKAGNWEVPMALRRLLSRAAALAMVRLMDESQPGRTGKSAGIPALLTSRKRAAPSAK